MLKETPMICCLGTMAARGAGSFAFIDKVTVDNSSRINSEVHSIL